MAKIERRKTKEGGVRWRVLVRRAGHRTVSATFARKADAERFALEAETHITRGRHLPDPGDPGPAYTVEEACNSYVQHALPALRMQGRAGEVQWWRERLTPASLDSVTMVRVRELRDMLAQTVSPATANRRVAALAAVFRHAREQGWTQADPVRELRKLQEPRGRDRYLSPAECERLLTACKASRYPRLYALVLWAMTCGARRGELLGLRRCDVDLDRAVAVARDTKNRETRALVMTPEVVDALRPFFTVPGRPDAPVFPGKGGRPVNPGYGHERVWREALVAAGITGLRFHDLRHTAASRLAMSGASSTVIAEVLGHKTLQMVRRYAHLDHGHLSRVVNAAWSNGGPTNPLKSPENTGTGTTGVGADNPPDTATMAD